MARALLPDAWAIYSKTVSFFVSLGTPSTSLASSKISRRTEAFLMVKPHDRSGPRVLSAQARYLKKL
jgi:hypothetical protein